MSTYLENRLHSALDNINDAFQKGMSIMQKTQLDAQTAIARADLTFPDINVEALNDKVKGLRDISQELISLETEIENFRNRFHLVDPNSENILEIRETLITDLEEITNDVENSLDRIENELSNATHDIRLATNSLQTYKNEVNLLTQEMKALQKSYATKIQTVENKIQRVMTTARTLENQPMTPIQAKHLNEEFNNVVIRFNNFQNTNEQILANFTAELDMKLKPMINEVNRNELLISELLRNYEDVKITYETLEETVKQLQMGVENLDIIVKNDISRSDCILKITASPCVEIFKLKPPPPINLSKFNNYQQLQAYVADQFALFRWPNVCAPINTPCGKINELSPAQLLSYHYMQPYNKNLNVLLAQSTGSGKTCAGMLIASIFARAGYTPLIVTKKSLKDLALRDALDRLCDFNIQQYLHAHNLDILPGNTPGEREQMGLKIWKEMGIHFDKKHCIMTYNIFSRIAVSTMGGDIKAGKERLKYLAANRGQGHKDDPIANCIVIIDEAHKLIGDSMDLNPNERGDYESMLKLMWQSYALSGTASARLVLLTATPIVASPVDLINLMNLLVPKSEALQLLNKWPTNNSAATDWSIVKPLMNATFEQKFTDSTTHTLKNIDQIERLCMGRISYVNLMGDPGRFARPQMEWVPITLTRMQREGINTCLKKHTELEYNPSSGNWRMQKGKKRNNYKKLVNTTALKKCIAKQVNWGGTSLPTKFNYEKQGQDKELLLHSRGMYLLLSNIMQARSLSHRILKQMPRESNQKQLRFMKQYIFTDFGGSHHDDDWGVELIASLLSQVYGFERINPIIGTIAETSKMTLKKNVTPYKGMFVLGSGPRYIRQARSPNKGSSPLKKAMDWINAPENADGRHCYLILNSGAFKEGVEFTQIGYAHIYGYMDSNADLNQAIARVIRNCSAVGLPYIEGEGWNLDITVYSPLWDANNLPPVPQLLKSSTFIEPMKDLLQRVAYDRTLFANVNTASDAITAVYNINPEESQTAMNRLRTPPSC